MSDPKVMTAKQVVELAKKLGIKGTIRKKYRSGKEEREYVFPGEAEAGYLPWVVLGHSADLD